MVRRNTLLTTSLAIWISGVATSNRTQTGPVPSWTLLSPTAQPCEVYNIPSQSSFRAFPGARQAVTFYSPTCVPGHFNTPEDQAIISSSAMSDKRTTGSNEVSSSSTLHASTQAFPQRLPRGNDEALHRFWRTFFGHDYNPEDTWDLVRTFAIGLAVGLVVSLIARGTTGIVSISAYTLMGIPVGFMMTLVFLERMFGARS